VRKLDIIAKYFIYILKECSQTFRPLLGHLQCKMNNRFFFFLRNFLPPYLPRKQPPPPWVRPRRLRVPVSCKSPPHEGRLHLNQLLGRLSWLRHRREACRPSIAPLYEPTAVRGLFELDPKGRPGTESGRCPT